MTDPYRVIETPEAVPERPGGLLRPLLWLVLFISAAINAVLSTVVDSPWIGSVFGLVAVLCGAALIVHHRRNR
ncbi:hypothetical protein [Micromonospora sp. NBC_00617]|uniref:hypothetical protein n=1 Tax=Micromonospora sp. NBC_00617 TaxID=2903587 RepID=UPI0030E210F8